MGKFAAVVGAVVTLLSAGLLGGEADNGMTVYRAGDYEKAIPLLRASIAADPKNAVEHAALLSSMVYLGRLDEATDAADSDAQAFPDSPEVLAAQGEYAYYLGEMPQAEKLFKAALKLKDSNARAFYGLGRLCYFGSLYRTARLLCLKAHDLDPDDARITQSWMQYLVPEKRREMLPTFMASHPWLYKDADKSLSSAEEISHELKGRKANESAEEKGEKTVRFVSIMSDARHVMGLGLELKINGGRPLRLLFDTGASGILISQHSVDKAGLSHLGSTQIAGIGDRGARGGFVAVADTCEIGGLQYKACVMRATQGKPGVAGSIDGLIGADVFSDYLMEIDFQRRLLHLVPQPPREVTAQGYDRVVPPNEKDFTPVFRSGGHLLITATLNGKTSGLFLLDTGASFSQVDSTFARLSTKIRGDSNLHIRGVSGEVKSVFEADKAVLVFAGFRQQNLGLVSFDLNNRPEHEETRLSGILGLPVLSMFRLSLDYRNGLVKFEYTLAGKN